MKEVLNQKKLVLTDEKYTYNDMSRPNATEV
jgi:hypothetical protein